jgi:hypothetical protein
VTGSKWIDGKNISHMVLGRMARFRMDIAQNDLGWMDSRREVVIDVQRQLLSSGGLQPQTSANPDCEFRLRGGGRHPLQYTIYYRAS